MICIYNFAINIACFLIINTIIENIIISREYCRYIKLFMGIVCIINIISMGEIELNRLFTRDELVGKTEYKNEKIMQNNYDKINDIYVGKIKDNMKRKYAVEINKIKVFNNDKAIKKIVVYVKSANELKEKGIVEQENIIQKNINQEINKYYNVENKNIEIRYR